MDSYQDIRVLPNPEFQASVPMALLFAKLHQALGARGKGDIGVSFPGYGKTPGDVLRLHGRKAALEELDITGWRAGLDDYCVATPVLPVPEIKGWRSVERVQVKSSVERLLRRSVRKGWITAEEMQRRLAEARDRLCTLPFIQMKSLSTGQSFPLFIRHGELQPDCRGGLFTSYGLSGQATIPWF